MIFSGSLAQFCVRDKHLANVWRLLAAWHISMSERFLGKKEKKNKNKKDEEEENPPSWNTFPECLSLLKTDKAWTEQMFPPKSRCGDVTFPGRKCGGVYY